MQAFLRRKSRVEKLSVLMLLTALAVAGLMLDLGGHPAASGATSPVFPCTSDMTAAKCASELATPRGEAVHARSTAGSRASTALSPTPVIACGQRFFSPGQWAELTSRFGGLSCFRLPGQRNWIVIGNGMSVSAPTLKGTPGGAMVAVEQCASSSCLNPSVTRAFASFFVTRPPDAATFPLQLETVFKADLLEFSDAYCGVFSFDTQSLKWYGGLQSQVQAVLSRGSAVPAIHVGPAVSGGRAVGLAKPAANRAACAP